MISIPIDLGDLLRSYPIYAALYIFALVLLIAILFQKKDHRKLKMLVAAFFIFASGLFLFSLISNKSCKNPDITVRIMSTPGRDYPAAIAVEEALTKQGCKVLDRTKWDGNSGQPDQADGPSGSQIRYFHIEDKDDAELIVKYIGKTTKPSVKLALYAPYNLSENSEEPNGRFEIRIADEKGYDR